MVRHVVINCYCVLLSDPYVLANYSWQQLALLSIPSRALLGIAPAQIIFTLLHITHPGRQAIGHLGIARCSISFPPWFLSLYCREVNTCTYLVLGNDARRWCYSRSRSLSAFKFYHRILRTTNHEPRTTSRKGKGKGKLGWWENIRLGLSRGKIHSTHLNTSTPQQAQVKQASKN